MGIGRRKGEERRGEERSEEEAHHCGTLEVILGV